MLECRLAESLIKPIAQAPLLTIFVPTFNRTREMIETVDCLASQVVGGLESKVEIVVSDNASEPEGQAAVRALAAKHPCVSYMFNAEDEGGYFQLFSAPWRSRGRWTWTFGSDDQLMPGGVAHILGILEREDPSFVTQNKRIFNRDLSEEQIAAVNRIPDRRFDTFVDLFSGVGIHQICFISAHIERTDRARAIDPAPYLEAATLHPHVLAMFEKHAGRRCVYTSANNLMHRTRNGLLHDYFELSLQDIGVRLPIAMMKFATRHGAPPDFFETINGSRHIDDYDPPRITYVDNMFEYTLRAIAADRFILRHEKFALEAILKHCRPGRLETFKDIWRTNEETRLSWEVLTKRQDVTRAEREARKAQLEVLNVRALGFTDKVKSAA
jgi:glycosyltransferase involved in cell wall biosynthesis